MRPSYTVSKTARKSSRYRSLHRYSHTPNRMSQSSKFPEYGYGNGFMGTILGGLAMLGALRKRTSRHAGGHIPKDNKRDKR
jgi:hypothetical protein